MESDSPSFSIESNSPSLSTEPYSPTTLPAPVLTCVCGECDNYLPKDDGDFSCGKCGCLPISHAFVKSASFNEANPFTPLLSPVHSTSGGPKGKKNKRPLAVSDKGTEDVQLKKAKVTSFASFVQNECGMFQPKPCTLLERGHLPFSDISEIPTSTRGVYKIAYKYKTIYVGSVPCYLRLTLRGHFNGNGNKDLYEFIKKLTQADLEKVSVFWLDETKHVHNCGKKSYLKCIEESERQKPRFNVTNSKKPGSSWWCSVM